MEKYLNAAKVFYYGKIRKPVKTADDALVEQIRDTCSEHTTALRWRATRICWTR